MLILPVAEQKCFAASWGAKVSEYLKVPVVVVYKPGASGSIAAAYVEKSNDDCYRVVTVGTSNLGILHVIGAKVPYTLKDFGNRSGR
jgi:tripartite-type tricarboxylate transporter receptor subunit TctC